MFKQRINLRQNGGKTMKDIKESYETPEIEVIEFETEDIITASGELPFVPV